MEVLIHSLEEFKSWIDEVKQSFGDKRLILLSGPMGAGKTQFVQFLIGENADVMSPTFAIHNNYELGDIHIDHVDLYRLDDEQDLESTGFWELFEKDSGWIIVEWADRLPESAYPLNWPKIIINIQVDENSRKIQVT